MKDLERLSDVAGAESEHPTLRLYAAGIRAAILPRHARHHQAEQIWQRSVELTRRPIVKLDGDNGGLTRVSGDRTAAIVKRLEFEERASLAMSAGIGLVRQGTAVPQASARWSVLVEDAVDPQRDADGTLRHR